MPTVSEFFDATKQYKEVEIQPGALVVADDISLIQDINNYDRRETAKFLQGFQLKIEAITNAPILKVKANNDLTEGQVITIEMTGPALARWRKNAGAWSGAIAVTADDVTWNTLGTSGLEVVVSSTAVASDTSEIWVAQGMRLLGGAITAPIANSFTLGVGKWSILGEFENFTIAKTVAATADDDYLYLKVETNEVDYTTDSELGTRLADGENDPKSIKAHDREYTLMSGAAFPDNTATPYAEYFIVGKVINAIAGTFTYMWDEPNDIQKIMRIFGDTIAPSTPTGLALTTGSELGHSTSPVDRVGPQIPLNGFLEASWDLNNETDIDYYELKIVRLATPGGAVTTDSSTYVVRPNLDAGGMGVPIGANYTIHNQTFGVPYGAFVRAVDYAGNVSNWSARVNEVIGGSTSAIAVGAAGPTFALTDTPGFVGVDVTVTALPANCEGFGIWVQEGSYPTTSPGTEWGTYNADVGTVSIPWKESGKPYIRIKGFDQSGLYQTLRSEDNVSLAASAQLATETHNDSLVSHGGLLTGIADLSTRYGSFIKWASIVETQGFAVQDVYIVAEGGYYATLQAALNAIALDRPAMALILLGPDASGDTSTIVFPDLNDGTGAASTKVTIQGLGTNVSFIGWAIDLSNCLGLNVPLSLPTNHNAAAVTFRDVTITQKIFGVKTGATFGLVFFDNVLVQGSIGTDGLMYFDGGAGGGGWYVYIQNSYLSNSGAVSALHFQRDVDFVLIDNRIIQYDIAGDKDAIYLTAPAGNVQLLKGNLVVARNGHTSTGLWLDSSVATTVTAIGNMSNTAPGANVTLDVGTIDSNSVLASNFLLS